MVLIFASHKNAISALNKRAWKKQELFLMSYYDKVSIKYLTFTPIKQAIVVPYDVKSTDPLLC